MKIHLIWAQDQNNGIGKNGKLPWTIPEDLKNFKKLTSKSTILMGRKTWDSLPIKPLPNRRNIIISKNNISNSECYNNMTHCIQSLKNDNIDKLFIIGGASIYKYFFALADELHITIINEKIENIDVYFPVTMNIIKKEFTNIGEVLLTKNAIYSHWVKKIYIQQ